MEKEKIELLKKAAKQAQKNSYAPYSGFNVGAALLTKEGKIFSGCNIENAAFSPGCCAERVALYKAVSEGFSDLEAILILGGKDGENTQYCAPCGVCRQVLREFVKEDFKIILSKDEGEDKVFSLFELLPESFGPDILA